MDCTRFNMRSWMSNPTYPTRRRLSKFSTDLWRLSVGRKCFLWRCFGLSMKLRSLRGRVRARYGGTFLDSSLWRTSNWGIIMLPCFLWLSIIVCCMCLLLYYSGQKFFKWGRLLNPGHLSDCLWVGLVVTRLTFFFASSSQVKLDVRTESLANLGCLLCVWTPFLMIPTVHFFMLPTPTLSAHNLPLVQLTEASGKALSQCLYTGALSLFYKSFPSPSFCSILLSSSLVCSLSSPSPDLPHLS